jgi:hypothetical protein
MSVYSVATTGQYEGCSAEVGWERSLAGYWFYVTDANDRRVISGGLDAYEEENELKHLVSLYDLVEATNGIVNWREETSSFGAFVMIPGPNRPVSFLLRHQQHDS